MAEADGDCDTDENEDPRLIRRDGDYDLSFSELVYDASRFRLQIRDRMSGFPDDPLDLDLHNLVRAPRGITELSLSTSFTVTSFG